MTTGQMIVAVVAGLLIPPAIISLSRKKGHGKRGKSVVVTCPKCNADLKLDRLRNYKCPKCMEDVSFFESKTKKPHKDAQLIKCAKCGETNFKGMKLCLKCDSPLLDAP